MTHEERARKWISHHLDNENPDDAPTSLAALLAEARVQVIEECGERIHEAMVRYSDEQASRRTMGHNFPDHHGTWSHLCGVVERTLRELAGGGK